MFLISIGIGITLISGYLLYQRISQKRLSKENDGLMLYQNLMAEHYTALQNQMVLTANMREEISSRMDMLQELMKQGDANDVKLGQVSVLQEEYQNLQPISYCDNIVVNSVIVNRIRQCKNEGIQVREDIPYFSIGKIRELELLGILYNMFDNAVEACRKVKMTKEPFIELECSVKEDILSITMRNSSPGVIYKRGHIVTTKKEQSSHGLGMGIICDLAKQHKGSVEIKTEGEVFEMVVRVTLC